MENKYDEIKEKHQQRVNNFPMIKTRLKIN